MEVFFFKFNKSLPNSFIIKEIGVITKKKIIPITIGETNFPNKIPNLTQALFKGVSIFDLVNPKNKKIKETTNDQILMPSLFNNGNTAMMKKKIKKTIPKLLLELILIF